MQVLLSDPAINDLEDIYDYTERIHGPAQAFVYTSVFDTSFDRLSRHPLSGRTRNEIRQGLRSIVKEHHVIYYRVLADHIRIVRILHSSKDIPRFFD